MNITESLNFIRQQLGTARSLAEQSGAGFSRVGADVDTASGAISYFSDDVYSAGSDDESTSSGPLGANAIKGLGAVAGPQSVARTDLGAVRALEPQLAQALKVSLAAAQGLAVRDVDKWFVTNAIDSAQRESGEAADSSAQIASSLGDADSELSAAKGSAVAVSRDAEGADVSFEGERLYKSVDGLDDSLRDAGRAAGHGADRQGQVAYYIDQALQAIDNLERDYGAVGTGDQPDTDTPASPPSWSPTPGPLPAPFHPAPSPVSGQSEHDGFFDKPWQG